VTDHKIFRELSSFWEADFLRDMDQLNVRRPDALTRVSEYVPKIVDYTQKIIANGFGCAARPRLAASSLTRPARRRRYESGGSVYFDVKAFDGVEKHHYAKLDPRAAFNVQLVEEGEGAISVGLSEKKEPWDFALWKASRPGEPVWPSPWSNVRCAAPRAARPSDRVARAAPAGTLSAPSWPGPVAISGRGTREGGGKGGARAGADGRAGPQRPLWRQP
jgi:cysteinyl-tRNA synthetase